MNSINLKMLECLKRAREMLEYTPFVTKLRSVIAEAEVEIEREKMKHLVCFPPHKVDPYKHIGKALRVYYGEAVLSDMYAVDQAWLEVGRALRESREREAEFKVGDLVMDKLSRRVVEVVGFWRDSPIVDCRGNAGIRKPSEVEAAPFVPKFKVGDQVFDKLSRKVTHVKFYYRSMPCIRVSDGKRGHTESRYEHDLVLHDRRVSTERRVKNWPSFCYPGDANARSRSAYVAHDHDGNVIFKFVERRSSTLPSRRRHH